MKKSHIYLVLIIGLLITVYGLITGKFYFLFLIIPLGFGFFRRKEDNSEG